MDKSKYPYVNLVFEGGGVKGAAYGGCLQVLTDYQLFRNVIRVAGTSAGSITAGMLAIGAGSEGLTESIIKSDFKDFIKDWGWIFGDIYRLLMGYGIHSGDGFTKILKGYIAHYTKKPNLTFSQLEALVRQNPDKYKELTIVASNITTQRPEVFDCNNTPDLPIWKAIRCSMSIPLVFEPYEINGNYYMDGGLGWIYPIDVYDEKMPDGRVIRNPKTLGFYLESANRMNDPGFRPSRMKIDSLKSTAMAMYDFLSTNSNSKHIHPEDKRRTVFIDDLDIRATDFDLSIEDKIRLIEQGRIATRSFLKSIDLQNVTKIND